MATTFVPVKSSTSVPMGRSFPSPSVSKSGLSMVPTPMAVVPKRAPAFNLELPLNRLMAGKSRCEYMTDETIFSQGDPANAVFYIQSGRVKLTVVSAAGKEAVIAHLPTGSFFGEAALAGNAKRVSSANALESSTIIRIEKGVMQDLLQREPKFADRFLTHLLARNIRMEADLVDHLFNSCEKRLARLLMLMANFGQETKPLPYITKISQETLSEMIGTTRSRVSFFLNRFRDLGYIDYDCAGMRINSTLVNVVLHD